MRTIILGAGVSLTMIAAVAIDTSSGCKPAVTAVIDLVNAECALLAQQPNEPIDEVFACQILDAAGNAIQSFQVMVPAAKAAEFSADHPIKAGHPLPQGAKP